MIPDSDSVAHAGIENLFMLSVCILSYGCTREVWRARRMRKSYTESNSTFLIGLTAKSMSKFFYNIAAKNACFLIKCKILVKRDTEKQMLLLAGYKHATIV